MRAIAFAIVLLWLVVVVALVTRKNISERSVIPAVIFGTLLVFTMYCLLLEM